MAQKITPANQAQYEAALPDRFQNADEWTRLANEALQIPANISVPANEYGIYVPWTTAGRVATAMVPGIWTLRPRYEELRLGAKYASLAGREAAQQRLNELYRGIRMQKTPYDVQRYEFAISILQQYITDPDRRLPFSKFLSRFGLAPGMRLK